MNSLLQYNSTKMLYAERDTTTQHKVQTMDLMTLLAIFCLLMVAVAFSPLGLGGGILYVPIMHYMLDWEIKEAIVASLTLVLMVSLGSSLAHSKSGHAEHKVAKWGRIAAVPSAIIGTLLSGVLLSLVGDIGIKILAALVITFVLERTIRKSATQDSVYSEEMLLEKRINTLPGLRLLALQLEYWELEEEQF